jgi:hypothetical protein
MDTVYPQKEGDQGTTGHQQRDGRVRAMVRPPAMIAVAKKSLRLSKWRRPDRRL